MSAFENVVALAAAQRLKLESKGRIRTSASDPNLAKKKIVVNGPSSGAKNSKPEKLDKPKDPSLNVRSLSRPPTNSRTERESRRSSSSDSNEAEKPSIFLKADLVQKLRRYDPEWFKQTVATHPEYFIDSRQYVYFERTPKPIQQTPADTCIRYVDCTNYGSKIEDIDFGSPINSMTVSQDFALLVLCVDYPRGPMLMTKTAENFETLVTYPARSTPLKMFISFTNEVLVTLAINEHSKAAILNCYGPMDGNFLGETEISSKNALENWEISVCPADETVICLKSDDLAYLLRRIPDEILIFSTIKLYEITCHVWADDVTLAFGTIDGQIRLYRETVPLNIVDLKPLHQNLLGNDVSTGTKVVCMYATDEILLVSVEIGIIYVFSSPENPERWKNSKAIVITSISKNSMCQGLHVDPSGDHLLYTDEESTWICDVRYSEALCKEGMRLVQAKHFHPIKFVTVDIESGIFASIDTSGKILAYQYSNFIGASLLPGGHQILLGTSEKITLHNILLYAFEEIKVVFEGKIQMMEPSPCNTKVFVCKATKFFIFNAEKFEKVFDGSLPCQHDISVAKWSANGKNIGVLTQKDDVYVIDSQNGTIVCFMEFKLRFFIDISIFDDTIFLINNKFLIYRIKNLKELDPINLHAEGVSFKRSSTGIIFNGKNFYMATDLGRILMAGARDVEHVKNMDLNHKTAITLIYIVPKIGQIFVGFGDGHIKSLKIENIEENLNNLAQENLILTPHDDIIRYRALLNELNAERNLIRDQAERVFNEYKNLKEEELEKLRYDLETELKRARLKIKDLEERCHIAENTKEETIEKMHNKFNLEVENLKEYYEKMVNDQIKTSLKKDEDTQKLFIEMEQNLELKTQEFAQIFREVQLKYEKKFEKMRMRTEKLKNNIAKLEKEKEGISEENFLLIEKYEKLLETKRNETENIKNEFLNKIKDVKANMLITEDERDEIHHKYKMHESKIELLTDELNSCKNLLEQQDSKTEELHKKLLDEENLNVELKKTLGKLNQKTIITQKEIDHEKFLRTQAERRLFEFESKLEEISHHVYDKRKLEQSVLALLAFFNTPKPTTTVVSKKKLF